VTIVLSIINFSHHSWFGSTCQYRQAQKTGERYLQATLIYYEIPLILKQISSKLVKKVRNIFCWLASLQKIQSNVQSFIINSLTVSDLILSSDLVKSSHHFCLVLFWNPSIFYPDSYKKWDDQWPRSKKSTLIQNTFGFRCFERGPTLLYYFNKPQLKILKCPAYIKISAMSNLPK
jgi:hypothetical protein